MSKYCAEVVWQKAESESFIDNKYSRGHLWRFDGGVEVPASSSPHIVPLPYSVEANVDPEEAFVASISSCHMLFFLGIAAKKKWQILSYVDKPVGVMEQTSEGVMMTEVTLRPQVTFEGPSQPSREALEKVHHQSHQQCFIANSIKTKVTTEMVDV